MSRAGPAIVQAGVRASAGTMSVHRSLVATFAAFIVFGSVSLVPFVVAELPADRLFTISAASSGAAFLALGVAKGVIVQRSPLLSGLQTLVLGGLAAALAYSTAALLRGAFGAD